jgi:hypothetical protein
MTLDEIAYAIAERKSEVRPISEVDLELLRFSVVYYRALFLRRDYTENLRFPTAALQKLDLPTVNVQLGKRTVLRSETALPMPVRLKNWQQFYYVGTPDGYYKYTELTEPQELSFRLANKYTGLTPCYYFQDGYIYIHNATPELLQVRYLLADPREAVCSSSYDPSEPFPIPADMQQVPVK